MPGKRHEPVCPITGLVDDACFVLDYYRIVTMLNEQAVVFLADIPLLSGQMPSVASGGDFLGDLPEEEQHFVVGVMLHSRILGF